MNENLEQEDRPIVEITIQFDKVEDMAVLGPGVFIPVDELLQDWERIMSNYIEAKVRSVHGEDCEIGIVNGPII